MIYSTNRTTSIGDITVEVNENYFGEGAMYFMQEAAEDELALFECAIKTDMDQVTIGESVSELKALNEGFIEKTINKVTEIMTKFIEWLKGVGRSAVNKLRVYTMKDTVKFCKEAKAAIDKINKTEFEATGTVLKTFKIDLGSLEKDVSSIKDLYISAGSMEDLTSSINEKEKKIREKIKKLPEEIFEKDKTYHINEVDTHLSFLENTSKSYVKEIQGMLNKFENDAKKVLKDIKKQKKEASEEVKNTLAMEAKCATAFKTTGQSLANAYLSIVMRMIKVAKAVVTRASKATKVNEEAEFSPELIDALIESSNYEIDEMLEEMSEGKSECDDDDDIEDDDDEE